VTAPDVVLIQADQLRADCLGVTGNPDVLTPHLDGLAADGTTFTEAFCPYPVCTPSRYSLLSGLYPHQHGGLDNHSTLAPGIDTIPRVLRRHGYQTTAVGKMHFTPTYLDVGYQRMILAEQHGPGRYDDDYHRDLRAAGLADVVDLTDQELTVRPDAPPAYWDSFGTGTSNLPDEWHSTTWIGDRAVEEIRGWAPDTPQLLHVSFIKPHHPFDPPAGWADRYRPEELTLLPGWRAELPSADRAWRQAYFDHDRLDEQRLRATMAAYYATISQLDEQVGRIVAALRAQGRYESSTIVFTADHGEYLGFHHLLLKHGPMYDPVLRVPLIMKLPGNQRAGHRTDALASTVDVAPTVAGICRTGHDPRLPGRDLTDTASRRTHVFAMTRDPDPAYLVRSATHKLITTAADEMLFDLRSDPLELRNLARDPDPGAMPELRRTALRWLQFDAPVPPYVDESAAVLDAPNVPDPDPEARREHRDYFLAAVRESRTE
jgi:arylsulfatase A-like enzyme